MPYTSLEAVQHRIQAGAPLPFHVRNADGTLLLARGQVVETPEQLEALCARGALVDVADVQDLHDAVAHATREQMPALWRQCIDRVALALRHAPFHGFAGALDDAALPVQALIARDPDLAIFQILRHAPGSEADLAARRSVHAGIVAFLVAQRLGWEASSIERVFKVALTMNVSVLDLQGALARRREPPDAAQQARLREHPLKSREWLEQAGIADGDWLDAVAKHHEMEDGSGYPSGCTDVGDLASLVRRADVYTGKLSSRDHRDALAADQAGRQMFMEDPGHPMTAALVKEFGLYPPGCLVRLASGETGFVVQRGPVITAPIVACLTNERGALLSEPRRLDTGVKAHRIEAIVSERSVPWPLNEDRLVALTLR